MMDMSHYERLIFERVREKFWQAFDQKRESILSFLDGLCQVFDLGIALRTKREGDMLKTLDVYPEGEEFKRGVLFEMDEELRAIIRGEEGYACNTTEEGSPLKRLGIDSLLVVPFEPTREEYLFLCNRKRPAQFGEIYTSYDLSLSQALAMCISIFPIEGILKKKYLPFLNKALENIYKQVSKEIRATKEINRLRTLLNLNRELNSPGEPSEVLGRGLELILRLRGLNASTGYILLCDEVTNKLQVIAAAGKEKDRIRGLEISKGMGIEGWVIEEGKPRYLNDVDEGAEFKSEIAKKAGVKTKSVLASPISIRTKIDEKGVVGVIALLNKPIPFKEEEEELLSGLSETIGMSIQGWMFIEERIKGIVGPYLPHTDLVKKDSPLHKVERREVSILFADMSGFTTATQSLGRDKEVADTLSEYFTQMSEIVFEREGIVDKFVGDGVMAIFWSAKNALLAAFNMKDEFEELKKRFRKKWGNITGDVIEVGIRFGIATNWVFIGDLGSDKRKSFTAIGSAVNLASRLVSEADAGKVWIDSPTYEKVEDIITESSSFKHSFKGIEREQLVYDIASIKQESPEEVYSKIEGYIGEGWIRRALLNLDRLIKKPGSLGLKPLRKKAGLLKDIGDYKEAIGCYIEVLEKDLNSIEALEGKAECLKKIGGRE